MAFLAYWRAFLNDVSKWVRVGWRQHDIIRSRGGLRPVHEGGEVANRWTSGGRGARSWCWHRRYEGADIGGQVARYRATSYTAGNLSRRHVDPAWHQRLTDIGRYLSDVRAAPKFTTTVGLKDLDRTAIRPGICTGDRVIGRVFK